MHVVGFHFNENETNKRRSGRMLGAFFRCVFVIFIGVKSMSVGALGMVRGVQYRAGIAAKAATAASVTWRLS